MPQAEEGDRIAGADAADFTRGLAVYLDRWGLIELADWHLPNPQGPLLLDGLPARAPASPDHGVHIIVPMHYPLPGDNELLRIVKTTQRQAAADLGLPAHAAGVSHHELYAQIFRIDLFESVLRSRWPDKPPKGAAGLIERAGGAVLGISAPSTRRLRILSNNLRSGKLSAIPSRSDLPFPPIRAQFSKSASQSERRKAAIVAVSTDDSRECPSDARTETPPDRRRSEPPVPRGC